LKTNGIPLFAAVSGMELSWCYAVFNYLCIGLLHRSCPVSPVLFSFLAGAAVAGLLNGRGLRRIALYGGQTLVYIPAVFLTLRAFNAPDSHVYEFQWLLSLPARSHDPALWLFLIFEGVMAIVFCARGSRLAGTKLAYESVIRRFDLGLSLIFVLFLIKFVLRIRFQVRLPDPAALVLMFVFLVLALSALALARTRNHPATRSQPGFRGVGWSVVAAVLALIVCSGTVHFFQAHLVSAAEGGYRLLSAAAEPLAPVILGLLQFLFGARNFRMDPPAPDTPAGATAGEEFSPVPAGGFADILIHFLAWAGLAAMGLAALAFMGILVYWLWMYLMSRRPGSESPPEFRTLFLKVFALLPVVFRKLLMRIIQIFSGAKDAVGLYLRLIRWGTMSGVRTPGVETPREYGGRLSAIFPELKNDIMKIVHALEKDVYSGEPMERGEFHDAANALRRLKSPVRWVARLKVNLWRLRPQRRES
jgi:hypothetical protein